MKKYIYLISLILFFAFGYLFGINTRPQLFKSPLSDTINNSKANKIPEPAPNQKLESKPEYVPQYKINIPAKYFDADEVLQAGDYVLISKDLKAVQLPIAINPPAEIQVIDEKFNQESKVILEQDIGDDIRGTDINNDGILETNIKEGMLIDVDNDGKKEKVIYGSNSMTHQPNVAIIVKNERVIFKTGYMMNIYLYESKSHNGFYLSEAFDIGLFPTMGGIRVARFIHKDGKFIPVWYQETYPLITTKP